jgi:hypothetical protein
MSLESVMQQTPLVFYWKNKPLTQKTISSEFGFEDMNMKKMLKYFMGNDISPS